MVDLFIDADVIRRVRASVDESSQQLAEAADRMRLLDTGAAGVEPLSSRVAEFGYEWYQVMASLAEASAATGESLGRVSQAVERMDADIERQFNATDGGSA